jgi:hypothetical protein
VASIRHWRLHAAEVAAAFVGAGAVSEVLLQALSTSRATVVAAAAKYLPGFLISMKPPRAIEP